MRILFTTTRGSSHLAPLLPYAQALVAQGHDVRIAGPENHRATLDKAGLEHLVMDRPPQDALDPIWARAATLDGDAALAIYLKDFFSAVLVDAALPGLLAGIRAWTPDLLVRESLEYAGHLAAEIAGIPHVRVEVHNGFFEERVCLPNVLTSIDTRREAHGLAPAGLAPFRREPIFAAFPAGLDGMADRGGQPTFRSSPQRPVTAPDGPRDWLPEDDTPLLYVTFGTVAFQMDAARGIYAKALAAVADLPLRVLMTTGQPIDPETLGPVPVNTRVECFVPQSEVLSRATLVLSHGGSGTMLGAMAAGLPQVIAPLFADQFENAKRVEAAGLGIAVHDPDPDRLRAAVQQALVDPGLRSRARMIGAEMAGLPGASAAAEAMLGVLRTGPA